MIPLQKQLSIQDTDEFTKQDEIIDVKHQEIIYYMYDAAKSVNDTPVDFLKAVNEMQSIDYNFKRNFIGFENKRTKECLQFVRLEEDK